MMRTLRLAVGGVLLACAAAAAAQPAGDKVTVRVVNYAELGKLIHSLKGKVVVVDFWADF